MIGKILDTTLAVAYLAVGIYTLAAQVYYEPWFVGALSLCWAAHAAADAFGGVVPRMGDEATRTTRDRQR
nr:MAG TPA: hypothetical protein [Caudoviricetes sp.]